MRGKGRGAGGGGPLLPPVRASPKRQMTPKQYQAYLHYLRTHPLPPKRHHAHSKRVHHKKVRHLAAPLMAGGWLGNEDHDGCAAAAVANHLLAATGIQVTDDDVLALYQRAAGGSDSGATIAAMLETLGEYGLGGNYPVRFAPADLDEGGWLLLGMTLTAAQQRQVIWDECLDAPEWGSHAAVLNDDEVITWGTAIPVTEFFLASHAEEAWSIRW